MTIKSQTHRMLTRHGMQLEFNTSFVQTPDEELEDRSSKPQLRLQFSPAVAGNKIKASKHTQQLSITIHMAQTLLSFDQLVL